MSFLERLKYAAGRDALRLHTPGHKGELSRYDLTELTDGSFPADAVALAERDIAAHYRAANATMLCGGSSQGVKAAIFAAGTNGVCDVNSHRSVFDGFVLSGKTAVKAGGDPIRPITLSNIRSAVRPDIGAVIVTSPTYFGFTADIDGIRDYCKSRGLLFIVDGAHGAHFGACSLLPPLFSDRCDICNVSAHKTLGALTQTAILLDNLDPDGHARLADAVAVMGTTSPSYILYASIADAVEFAGSDVARSAYAALYEPLCSLRGEYPFLKNDDFTRLVLDCAELGVAADRLNAALCSLGVMSELVTERYIVFLFTAADTPESAERLRTALGKAMELV